MKARTLSVLAVLLCTAFSEAFGAARPAPGATAGVIPSNYVSFECPEGCADGFCVTSSTGGTGGYRCSKCVNNLFVSRADGQCWCIAGKYSPSGGPTCADCPVGSYCPGSMYTAADPPQAIRCPANMTTRGRRGTSDRACVNLPGYSYDLTDTGVMAVLCPVNTFGPGLRKQRACVPCPTGYVTMGKVGQILPSACVIPPGYYLKGPGQVAPCPQGEYKSGTGSDAHCGKCAIGVTTLTSASTSVKFCAVLEPGWYAKNISDGVITAAMPCPQGYWCPGGAAQSIFDPAAPELLLPSEPSIKACPSGLWTVDLASTTVNECLTPPGYKTANGTTVPCEDGSFRSGWAPLGLATTCTSCGTGVRASKTDRVLKYDLASNAPIQIEITTSSDDCYILPGQGLYYEVISQTWRARNCINREYGVESVTYGLAVVACRACPQNMITSTNSTTYPNSAAWFVNSTGGAGGFTSVLACVNQAGYGYNGRVSQPCDRGTYNVADTYGTCTSCGYGWTTAAVGTGKSQQDCGIAVGYGWDGAAVVPCPIGTYNNASYAPANTSCISCPNGTTTGFAGADDVGQCNLCTGGWGGPKCLTQCGGTGLNATYGDNGRPYGSDCMLCTWASTGFSFQWQGQNDLFSAQALSPMGADSSWDCVSEFAQIVDGSWYLPTAGNTAMNITYNISTFAGCVALCTAPSCEYVTYDYRAQACYVRIAYDPEYLGAPLIAFKAIPSGDVATNAFSLHRHGAPANATLLSSNSSSSDEQQGTTNEAAGHTIRGMSTSATAVSSGQYSFYIEPNADSVGTQSPAPNRASFSTGFAGLQQCLNACDDQTWCVGITMQLFVDIPTSPRSCSLIRGDASPGRLLRSVTRADVDRLKVPDIFTRQP